MISKAEVKYIQSLYQKKFRQQENLFIAEGPKIIEEALNNPVARIKKIFATQDWIDVKDNQSHQINVTAVSDADLKRISQLKTPNQVLALVEIPKNTMVLNKKVLSLVLDGIQDPGNMGTIIRIADWFGITQIICSDDCADVYNHKVVQASMGSIFRAEIFYTDLSAWIPLQKESIIYGAMLEGIPLKSYGCISNGLLVIGNESKGIRAPIVPYLSQKITIERFGQAESLNAAVATGIILSHIV
ncbi:MAG: TrmH family RNA methyltransferase [Niabella sp.]